MRSSKTGAWLALLSVLVLLSVTGCATKPDVSVPPAVVEESVIPPLSNELKQLPQPSGSYWSRVTLWRNHWQETLKTLPPKSGD